jgi:hypothetical protein
MGCRRNHEGDGAFKEREEELLREIQAKVKSGIYRFHPVRFRESYTN